MLCNLVGRDLDAGLLPDDWPLVSRLVSDVCYGNARTHFGFFDPAPV
ncbi:MAG: glucuronate isomerase [Kiritimatiellia bacterium]